MTPDNTETSKKRITVNLENIDYKIIDALEGVIANSKSAVIYQMIKEWINQNSEHIMKTWEIDLAGIRRQVIAETRGLSIKKELKDDWYQYEAIYTFSENYIGLKGFIYSTGKESDLIIADFRFEDLDYVQHLPKY